MKKDTKSLSVVEPSEVSDTNEVLPNEIAALFNSQGFLDPKDIDTVRAFVQAGQDAALRRERVALVLGMAENGIIPRYTLGEDGETFVPDISGRNGMTTDITESHHQFAIVDLFKASSNSSATLVLNSLIKVADSWESTNKSKTIDRLNGLIASVDSINPQDHTEVLLASQIAATHMAAMESLGAIARSKTVDAHDLYAKHAAKLLKISTEQIAALDKHRNSGKQTILVKHVHVHDGGQAVVGDVHTGEKPTK